MKIGNFKHLINDITRVNSNGGTCIDNIFSNSESVIRQTEVLAVRYFDRRMQLIQFSLEGFNKTNVIKKKK